MKEKKVFLSVCIITKNEERFIDSCLKSVQNIADEIIIVDAFSTDKTKKKAKKTTKRKASKRPAMPKNRKKRSKKVSSKAAKS